MRQLKRLIRIASLIALAVLGTSLLMYCAPGYFSDLREMDATHAHVAEGELAMLHAQQTSVPALLRTEIVQWSHGDLGVSRQYGTSVSDLLRESLPPSAKLLLSAVCLSWFFALLFAVVWSLYQSPVLDTALAVVSAVVLAVPVGALATLCLVANFERPVLVLAVIVGVRDFKVLQPLLQSAWRAPYLLYARAQGLSTTRMLLTHVLPALGRELFSLGLMSLTLALSALIPVEVIFDRSGIGRLAWNAAINRDLPVLVTTTALVAIAIGLASLLTESQPILKARSCE